MMTEPSENGDYQPVRDKQVNSSQSTVSDDIIGTKPTWTLPPKALPARGLPNFSRSIFFASLITAHSLVALLVLLTRIWSLLPNKYIERGPDRESMLPFSDWVYKPWANTISCDLVSANASAFEDAFTIDLRSHLHLSFAKAKLIDVVWDLVIGQGGRLLLAWISYGVFMDGLTRLMETSTVSYQLYASIVFETSSLASTWCSLKAVFIGHDWRGRAFLAWFGLATLCTLAYPTLMSAATGYLKPSDIRYRVLNDTLISPDSSDLNYCIQIHNAPAIGLDDGYIVPGPSNKDLFEVYNDERSSENLMTTYAFYDLLSSLKEGTARTGRDVYDYIKANNLSTLAKVPDLLFAYSFSHRGDLGITWLAPNGSFADLGNRIGIRVQFCLEKTPLPPGFESSLECLARPYFVWGFSSILLYIVLSLQLVWILGMFIIWLDANIYSKLCRKGRRMHGSFRNALDLAEAIRELLGDDICAYSDKEIARQLAKSGHKLQFYSTSDTDDSVSHIGISSFKGGPRLRLNDGSLYGRLGKDQD